MGVKNTDDKSGGKKLRKRRIRNQGAETEDKVASEGLDNNEDNNCKGGNVKKEYFRANILDKEEKKKEEAGKNLGPERTEHYRKSRGKGKYGLIGET